MSPHLGFADYCILGLVAHVIADWFFQNEWMAVNKSDPSHWAAWVHSGIHFLLLSIVFSGVLPVILAAFHFWIDLRTPLIAWRTLLKQTTEGPAAMHVAFWQDQAAHALLIVAAAGIQTSGLITRG